MPPPQPDIPGPSKPIAPTKETISTEETTRADVPIQPTQKATTEISSSHDPTTTWSSLYLVFTYYISRHNYLFWCFIFWDWMYCMIISHIVLSQSNIYTSFFIIFAILLFPLLITLLFFESCGFSYTTQTPCHSGGTTSSLYLQSLLPHWGQCWSWLGGGSV